MKKDSYKNGIEDLTNNNINAIVVNFIFTITFLTALMFNMMLGIDVYPIKAFVLLYILLMFGLIGVNIIKIDNYWGILVFTLLPIFEAVIAFLYFMENDNKWMGVIISSLLFMFVLSVIRFVVSNMKLEKIKTKDKERCYDIEENFRTLHQMSALSVLMLLYSIFGFIDSKNIEIAVIMVAALLVIMFLELLNVKNAIKSRTALLVLLMYNFGLLITKSYFGIDVILSLMFIFSIVLCLVSFRIRVGADSHLKKV